MGNPHDTDGGWNPDRSRREYNTTTWSKLEMAFMQQLADRKGVTISQVIRDGVHLHLVNNGLRPDQDGQPASLHDAELFIKREKKRIFKPQGFIRSEPGELIY